MVLKSATAVIPKDHCKEFYGLYLVIERAGDSILYKHVTYVYFA